MKRIIYTFLLASLYTLSLAQSDVDALRYSMPQIGSTARSMGSGGAFGALGADFSSATINPAGIGMYRTNQFVLSAGMINAKSETDYLGRSVNDNEFNMHIPNVGLVFTNRHYEGRKPKTSGWIFTNFALGMSRGNSFSQIINYAGTNSNSSMLDYFAQRANGLSTDQLGGTDNEFDFGFNDIESMAWEAYLIDSIGDRTYGAAIDPNARAITQKQTISTTGSTNDFHMTLAANYSDKFFIGGGLAVSSVKFKEFDKFREIDDVDGGAPWDSWVLERNLTTTGVGVSGRLGLVIKPNKWLRAGLAMQTPSIYSLKDEYSDQLASAMDNGDSYAYDSKDGNYSYKVVTPLKSTVSASAVLGKTGFVSTDIEFVDYSTMRLRPSIDAFDVANELIREKYKNAVNFRLGGEYVLDMYRFRGGYARYASPFADSDAENLRNNYFTAGIGIKDVNWALDLAFVHKRGNLSTQPYALNGVKVETANSTVINNQMVITLSSSF